MTLSNAKLDIQDSKLLLRKADIMRRMISLEKDDKDDIMRSHEKDHIQDSISRKYKNYNYSFVDC